MCSVSSVFLSPTHSPYTPSVVSLSLQMSVKKTSCLSGPESVYRDSGFIMPVMFLTPLSHYHDGNLYYVCRVFHTLMILEFCL